jgi:hypothetical protein
MIGDPSRNVIGKDAFGEGRRLAFPLGPRKLQILNAEHLRLVKSQGYQGLNVGRRPRRSARDADLPHAPRQYRAAVAGHQKVGQKT